VIEPLVVVASVGGCLVRGASVLFTWEKGHVKGFSMSMP
jgi:hypothetical protein